MRATVVHEAKHLASFAERLVRGVDFEEPWLEEATARIAEELYSRTFPGGGAWKGNVGFASSVGCEVLQCDDRPLIMWKHFTGLHGFLREVDALSPLGGSGTMAAYASGWALVRWVADRSAANEGAWFRALVGGDAGVGLGGLARVAKTTEQELLAAWSGSLALEHAGERMKTAAEGLSWHWPSMMTGLAELFPGTFSAHPMRMGSLSAGTFQQSFAGLAGGGTRFLALDGGSGAVLRIELRTPAVSPVRLSIARLP
jgi:hypothetical protein